MALCVRAFRHLARRPLEVDLLLGLEETPRLSDGSVKVVSFMPNDSKIKSLKDPSQRLSFDPRDQQSQWVSCAPRGYWRAGLADQRQLGEARNPIARLRTASTSPPSASQYASAMGSR